MKLYHGTSTKYLKAVLKHGLKPRGKRKSHWTANPSHPDAVYLTNAYAVYYAQCVAKAGDDLLIVEVDTDKLRPFDFAPDEDCLEQVGRGRDGVPGDMHKRTRHYRDRLPDYCGSLHTGNPAALSLRYLGNCTYFGHIPPEAISRYAVIKVAEVDKSLLWQAIDPSIVIMNYRICGAKYRNMVRWVFGDELEPEQGIKGVDFNVPASRAGIKIKEVDNGKAS